MGLELCNMPGDTMMEFKIEGDKLQICNGNHMPVSFGNVGHNLAAGLHFVRSEHIGDKLKILRFGHVSECLQRSLKGWILNHGDIVLLTVT